MSTNRRGFQDTLTPSPQAKTQRPVPKSDKVTPTQFASGPVSQVQMTRRSPGNNREIGYGGYNSELYCSFLASPAVSAGSDMDSPELRLGIGIGGISWTYTMNYNTVDTLGGQVIQMLGVSIDNLTIRGNFGGDDPWWGESRKNHEIVSRFQELGVVNDVNAPHANGMIQMAQWFRSYFESTTQGVLGTKSKVKERYLESSMVFSFPARGWKLRIRPTEFPVFTMNNETLAPEWTINAEFIEDFEDSENSFLDEVSDFANAQLNKMKAGVGFTRNNPFSEHLDGSVGTSLELSIKAIEGWEKSIWDNFSEEEINVLAELGYSLPANALDQAKLTPAQFRKEVQDLGAEIGDVAEQLRETVRSQAARNLFDPSSISLLPDGGD